MDKCLEPSINMQLTFTLDNCVVIMGEKMHRDPVCGAILDETTSRFKIKHEGETYYFCSTKCKKKFKRHRRKFVK